MKNGFSGTNGGKTPSYIKKSVHAYLKRNRRCQIMVGYDDYQNYIKQYGENYSFSGYVKSLMDSALETGLYGQLTRQEIRSRVGSDNTVEKYLVFSHEYETRLLEKYPVLNNKKEASLLSFLQWLVHENLKTTGKNAEGIIKDTPPLMRQ